MEKYIKVSWPESQKFMEYEECYIISNIEGDSITFVPEDLYNETIKDLTYPKEYDTNLGLIRYYEDKAIVQNTGKVFDCNINPKKGDMLLLYIYDEDKWITTKCTGSATGFPLLVEDPTLLIGINCELIGSYDPDIPF